METARLNKRICKSEVEERERGRLSVRWRNVVEMYMRENGASWEEGVLMSLDRSAWRLFSRG